MRRRERPRSTRVALVAAGLALPALAAFGCRDEQPDEPAVPADTLAEADSAAAVVGLHGLALRLEAAPESPTVLEVGPGTPLRVIARREGWLQVATWDDRTGWVAETETLEIPLWIHYQQALGGAPLSDLRPVYPLTDGRWAVEARFPSGLTVGSPVWVSGEPPLVSEVTAFENVASECGDAHRMAILAEGRAGQGRVAGPDPFLARARLALPGGPDARLRRLARRLAAPAAGQVQSVARVADSLVAAARSAEAAPQTFAAAEWIALGEDALWATLAGEPGRTAAEAASWAAAVVVLGRGPEAGVQVVVEPYAAPGQPPALHLVDAFSTPGSTRPSLFVVQRLDYGGQRIDLYAARPADVRRLYAGYPWRC